MPERCVCCGAIIPEGRQVCPKCVHRTNAPNRKRLVYAEDVLENLERNRAYMTDVGMIHAKNAVNDAPTVERKWTDGDEDCDECC